MTSHAEHYIDKLARVAGMADSASGVNSCHSYTANCSHERSHAYPQRTHNRLLPKTTPNATHIYPENMLIRKKSEQSSQPQRKLQTHMPRKYVLSKQQFTQTINPFGQTSSSHSSTCLICYSYRPTQHQMQNSQANPVTTHLDTTWRPPPCIEPSRLSASTAATRRL